MRPKISLKSSLLIVVMVGIIFSLVIVFFLIFSVSAQNKPPLLVSNQNFQNIINIGLPIRLKIPKINVNTTIEYVGLDSNKAMDVPKNQDNVAWFNLGPRPGENGSAVIAGHYGWKGGKASVFDNLYKLRKGDKIFIEDDNGAIISFAVVAIRRYTPDAEASGVFISNDGKSHLNLITCEGDWDKESKSYSQRLVIFTDKE